MRLGTDVLMSREYLESYRLLDCDALAARFTKPLLVIAAGDGVLVEGAQRYAANAKQGELEIIPNADHNFVMESSMERLFTASIDWQRELDPRSR